MLTNVTVKNFYRNSLLLFWTAEPTDDTCYILWSCPHDETQHGSKLIHASQGAAQIQPLFPDCTYTVTITPYGATGASGPTLTFENVTPNGSYEGMLYNTHYKHGGFLYDAGSDYPMQQVDRTIWEITYKCGRWEEWVHPSWFGHSVWATNHQLHFHGVGGPDDIAGTGFMALRMKLPIVPSNSASDEPIIYLANDRGPIGRAAAYLLLTPTPVDHIDLRPNQTDVMPLLNEAGQYLGIPDLRFQWVGDNIVIRHFDGLRMLGQWTFSRGKTYHNVQQIMGIRIKPGKVELLIDTDYSGKARVIGTIPVNLWTWNEIHVAISQGFYNLNKTNDIEGYMPDGTPVHEYFDALWHLHGVVMHNGNRQKLTNPVYQNPNIAPHHNEEGGTSASPVVPYLDTMPSHEELGRRCLPEPFLRYTRKDKAEVVRGPLNVTVEADCRLTPAFAADLVPLSRLQLLLDTNVVYLETTPGVGGRGIAQIKKSLTLNTLEWSNGYHQLQLQAHTPFGTYSRTWGDTPYAETHNNYLLVHNLPPQPEPPTIELVVFDNPQLPLTHPDRRSEIVWENGNTPSIPIKVGTTPRILLTCRSRTLPSNLRMTRAMPYGVNEDWSKWQPAKMMYTQLDGWYRWTMEFFAVKQVLPDGTLVPTYIESWWPGVSSGQQLWTFRVKDADGHEVTRDLLWQYV